MDDSRSEDPVVEAWISECHLALNAADALAVRMGRMATEASEIALLRLRIAALRSDIERRREQVAVAVERRNLDPEWIGFPAMTTPWCAPEEAGRL